MKTMKLAAAAAAVVLAAALSGCTAAVPDPVSTAAPAVAAPATTAKPLPAEWTGTFVSQGTATSGTITIRRVGEKLTLTLADFSTAEGEQYSLGINLNPGAMTKDPDGHFVVENPAQYEVDTLKSSSGNQTYELPVPASSLPEVHSATIYDYSAREAFGSASLTASPPY